MAIFEMANLASRHGYMRCFLLFQLFSTIFALDLRKGSLGRRHVLEKISAVVIGGAATASIGPFVASAAVEQTSVQIGITKDISSFTAYNIIPDATASLDPRLVKLKKDNFFKALSSGKKGGAIWLGEHHNSAKDHTFQAEFIQSVHQERKRLGVVAPMAIGLEQVQVQFQPALDDFIGGKISLDEMRQMVEWDKRWMWPFEVYAPVFQTAKDLGIRLMALNVDSEDLIKVEKQGYPGLPPDRLRRYIKDPAGFGNFAKGREFSTYVNYVISPSYDMHQQLGLLRYSMSGERLDEQMPFRNFLSGRILWDEAMASEAYSWTDENPGGLIIGLAGADHIKFRNGIPGRFSRLAGDRRDCTAVVINPTLIDSRPSGSVANNGDSFTSQNPDRITLQIRYLKEGIDAASESRELPESTGGVLPFADYIIIT